MEEYRPIDPSLTKENTAHKIPETTFFSSLLATEEEKQKLREIRQVYDAVWRPIEQKVMSSFEDITHNKWKPHLLERGINITLTANRRSQWYGDGNGTMDLRCSKSTSDKQEEKSPDWKSTYEILGSHVHELGHGIESPEDKKYMRETFGNRIDPEFMERFPVRHKDLGQKKNRFLKEVYADVAMLAVAEKHFTEQQVNEWKEQRRAAYNNSVIPFIDSLSDEEKRAILDKEFRKSIAPKNGVEQKEKSLHKKISAPLKKFFIRRK